MIIAWYYLITFWGNEQISFYAHDGPPKIHDYNINTRTSTHMQAPHPQNTKKPQVSLLEVSSHSDLAVS
ncbi:hypothetical protein ACFGXG_07070, partial [Pasteurella multocida]